MNEPGRPEERSTHKCATVTFASRMLRHQSRERTNGGFRKFEPEDSTYLRCSGKYSMYKMKLAPKVNTASKIRQPEDVHERKQSPLQPDLHNSCRRFQTRRQGLGSLSTPVCHSDWEGTHHDATTPDLGMLDGHPKLCKWQCTRLC